MATSDHSPLLAQAMAGLCAVALDLEPKIRQAAAQLADAALAAGLPPRERFGQSADITFLRKQFKGLRNARAHNAVQLAAEALAVIGLTPGWLLQFHAQALVERGAFMPALGVVRQGLEAATFAGDAETEAELLSLEGRVFKELYVASVRRNPPAREDVREDYLRRAADAYGLAFTRLGRTAHGFFPAVNLLALTRLARREQMPLPLVMPADGIATWIVNNSAKRLEAEAAGSGKPVPAWDIASLAEAHLHRGEEQKALDAITLYLQRLNDEAVAEAKKEKREPQLSSFAINGTLRQFSEIWNLDGGNAKLEEIVTLLRYTLMTSEGGAMRLDAAQQAQLTAAPAILKNDHDGHVHGEESGVLAGERYEKVFGADGPMGLSRLQDILRCSHVVARIVMNTESRSNQTVGTGFLLQGAKVHAEFKDDVLLFTNAHVISPHVRDRPAATLGEAWLKFDTAGVEEDVPLDQTDWLWTSRPIHHDVTIFRIPRSHPKHGELKACASRIRIAKGLPPLKQRAMTDGVAPRATRVYVIGHPQGQELSFSLNDNELLDYENVYGVEPGPEPRKLHYLAPTEPGNSGSPVFNSRTLELIGIHHAGGARPKLNGQPGTYLANEGLWIRPALNAFLMERRLGMWTPG